MRAAAAVVPQAASRGVLAAGAPLQKATATVSQMRPLLPLPPLPPPPPLLLLLLPLCEVDSNLWKRLVSRWPVARVPSQRPVALSAKAPKSDALRLADL